MNLTIRDQPIFEDESQAQQAMDDMANTLRMVSMTIKFSMVAADMILIFSPASSDETKRRHHPGPTRRAEYSICS